MRDAGERRHVLAVIGDGGELSDGVREQARRLGRLAVDAGFRVVTGGLEGVMRAASEGGRMSGAYQEGDIVAIVPGYQNSDANASADIVIATGLGHARNVLVVATASVVIAIGGRAGTLSEVALATKLDKPVIALIGTGGWAERLAGQPIDDRAGAPVFAATSPEAAIEQAERLLAE